MVSNPREMAESKSMRENKGPENRFENRVHGFFFRTSRKTQNDKFQVGLHGVNTNLTQHRGVKGVTGGD